MSIICKDNEMSIRNLENTNYEMKWLHCEEDDIIYGEQNLKLSLN